LKYDNPIAVFNKEIIDATSDLCVAYKPNTAFYEKYGAWAVALGRFVPVIRTFVPILAGVGKMKWNTFLKFNTLGAILWPSVVMSVGYFFGSQFPAIHQYVMPVIGFLFLITLIPIFWAMFKKRKEDKKIQG
jgi:membrane-associated protein